MVKNTRNTMLSHLRIRDFAIIDDLTIPLGPGFTVVTGETGAGKSIIVDALALALGERALGEMVRSGQKESVVEAFFDVPAHPLADRLGIGSENGIILRRNLSSAGKSRAFVNDSMVAVQTLLELGRSLVDIHGQHEHQSLLSRENQLTLLDAYGNHDQQRAEVGRLFRGTSAMRNELSLLTAAVKEKEQRSDLLRFQIQEIDAASLKPEEKERLEEERSVLKNLARLKDLTDGAYRLLYSGDGSLTETLSSVTTMIREVSHIDPRAGEILALLDSAKPLIEDASYILRSFRERYELDPDRLETVEERLDLIRKLERKYGEGIEAVLRHRDEAEQELQRITGSDERIRGLGGTLAAEEKLLLEQAHRLSELRKKTAGKIERAVSSILRELAMEKSTFVIDLQPAPLSASGADAVEFLFSANEGEPPKSLAKTASGGELSRVMLSLKETLADVDNIPVLIFDEVDAGIGGRVAERVGMRLRNLSGRHQVLCITHLPQIAALADHHIAIEKVGRRNGVAVVVRDISGNEREEEIARMLSGKITDISLKHARQLIGGTA